MAQAETSGEQAKNPFNFNLAPEELTALSRKRMEDFVNAQTELLNELQEANRGWLDRIQTEAKENAECASKLAAARSIPDAVTACQDWANHWLEMMSEDRKHLLSDYQKFAETGARLFSNGWATKGSA